MKAKEECASKGDISGITVFSCYYLYYNTLLEGWVILSVCLSVRYRNHFPVVQFQNQAHILNPHGTGQVYKTIWGAEGAPNFGRPFQGAPAAPQIVLKT